MAEPIALEFDLTPEQLAGIYAPKQQRVRGFVVSGLALVIGVAALVVGVLTSDPIDLILGVLLTLFGAFALAGLFRMPQTTRRVTDRLAGPTKVELSDRGLQYSGVNAAERIEWSRVMFVLDRPQAWVLMTKAPSTSYYIPKSVVPAEQREALAAALKTWSGRAYKIRKR